jgi:hypothetical protein
MLGMLWKSTRSYVLATVSLVALAACSGGGGGCGNCPFEGGGPTPTPAPAPTPTPTTQPCAGLTAAPTSGSAVFYLSPSCTTANSVAGFTISGDKNGLLVAASTVDESVPFTTATPPAQQAAPGTDTLEVAISAGETVSALRHKAGVSSRKVDLRSFRTRQRVAGRRFMHPRMIASRKLAALLAASRRGAVPSVARKRSILPTTVGSTAGIWTLNTSNTYVQVNSTLVSSGNFGDMWIDNTLLAANGGPLSASDTQAISNDFDNAWEALAPAYGTPVYTINSPGEQEETNCNNGNVETIFIPPSPDGRQSVYVISSASNGGFGSYVDPANLVYNDIATNCLGAESNESSGVYIQYTLGDSNDPLNHQLDEDDVALTANDLSNLTEFVGQTMTNPNSNGGYYLTTGYVDSPFITNGLGQLAEDFAVARKYPQLTVDVDDNAEAAQTYLGDPPSYSLTAFYGTDPGGTAEAGCEGCFGDAYLFARYAYDRFGTSYPSALINSGLTGFSNLANAFGATTTPQNVIADYAVASAVSGEGYTSDAHFNVSGFTTFGTYTDQFGNTVTLTGPTASATQNVATDLTYAANLGSFLYLDLGGLPASATVQVTDGTGAFGLEAALSQH